VGKQGGPTERLTYFAYSARTFQSLSVSLSPGGIRLLAFGSFRPNLIIKLAISSCFSQARVVTTYVEFHRVLLSCLSSSATLNSSYNL